MVVLVINMVDSYASYAFSCVQDRLMDIAAVHTFAAELG